MPELATEVGLVAVVLIFELFRGDYLGLFSKQQAEVPKKQKAMRDPSISASSKIEPKSKSSAVGQTHLAEQLQVAAKTGDLVTAEKMFKHMQHIGAKPSVICYGALIGACAKAGDVDGAEKWLEGLAGAGLGKPNTICVNMTISACAKSGDCARAEAWISKMQELGVEPDVMSYNAVIDACARVCEIARAEGW